MSKLNFKKELKRARKEIEDTEITYLKFTDYEKLYKDSRDNDYGFVIDETINYQDYFDKKNIEDFKEISYVNSIFSYKYGIDIHDEERVIDLMYSCDCGQVTGPDNLDLICPNCHSAVKRMKPKRIGWFTLNKPFKIINPFILFIMTKYLSPIPRKDTTKKKKKKRKKVPTLSDVEVINLDEVKDSIMDDENNDDTPDIETPEEEKERKTRSTKSIDNYYSILEAISNGKIGYRWYDLIMDKEKLDNLFLEFMPSVYELFKSQEDKWYTSKIIVISKNFRNLNLKKVEVMNMNAISLHNKLNIHYMAISSCVNALNNFQPYLHPKSWMNDKVKILHETVAQIGQKIFGDVGGRGKYGYIRSDVYGKKYSFSGRLVIETVIDENITCPESCQISIDFFRVTFANDILKIGRKLKLSPKKIHDLLDIDYTITDEDKKLIREKIFPMVEYPIVYINREPDIYVTSILALKIHSLVDDMILRIPTLILSAMNADFDGDILLNIIWQEPSERKRILETLGIRRSIIDTFNVSYNDAIGPCNNAAVLWYLGMSEDAKITKKGEKK